MNHTVIFQRYGRTVSSGQSTGIQTDELEATILDKIRQADSHGIHDLAKEKGLVSSLSANWDLSRKCAKELMALDTKEDMVK